MEKKQGLWDNGNVPGLSTKQDNIPLIRRKRDTTEDSG